MNEKNVMFLHRVERILIQQLYHHDMLIHRHMVHSELEKNEGQILLLTLNEVCTREI